MRQSLVEYLFAVLRRWVWLLVSVIAGGAGLADLYVEDVRVPFWALVTIAGVSLFLAQFLAFHHVRVERDEVTQTQAKAVPADKVAELEELISYLKEEQGNAAAWIAGGLSGVDYQDVSAEMQAWAVTISRRLRKYDHELARVFNEDDRPYTSLDLRAFLDRRLQQLGKVIAVLEGRRDSA